MRPRPRHISVSNSQGVLVILWDDDRRCEYSFALLRAACPCAECRASRPDQNSTNVSGELEIPLQSVQVNKLDRVEEVGNYALQLIWKDGHSFGIYSWDYLRGLCPENNV
jgi:DUF971 family protein